MFTGQKSRYPVFLCDRRSEVVDAADAVLVHERHQVAALDAGFRGWTVLIQIMNPQRVVAGQFMETHGSATKSLRGADDAEVAATDATVTQQLGDHRLCGLGRHGKANALGSGDDGGVDADDFAPRVQQWTAGVAWVQWSRVLNDVLDEPPVLATQTTAQGADDAAGDRRFKAEWIAHGDHQLAGSETFGIPEGRRGPVPNRPCVAGQDRWAGPCRMTVAGAGFAFGQSDSHCVSSPCTTWLLVRM